jgi:proteasome accessory factor B
MSRPGNQLRRLIRFVEELKRDRCPNAVSMARRLHELDLLENRSLAACVKTVKRDIAALRERYDAPLEFDRARNGYRLIDTSWVFPFLQLGRDDLFASLLSAELGRSLLPGCFQATLESAMAVQLAAGDPDGIPQDVLKSIIVATAVEAPAEPALAGTVIRAWRDGRRLRLSYAPANHDAADALREVDVHALFLSDGAWYARVFCHLRGGVRSLALHRILHAELLDARFHRSAEMVAELKSGHVFDYARVRSVVVRCDRDKARVIREREWFPGQRVRSLADGRIELTWPEVNRPQILWWVLSYAGHLEVCAPADLRQEVCDAASRIREVHAARRTAGDTGTRR